MIRRRIYTRLTADAMPDRGARIGPQGAARTLDALREFARLISECRVGRVHAVATGLIREAVERESFLARLRQETGIRVAIISGEQEAALSGKGALSVLGIRGDALIFDLGGGTTEFFRRMRGETKAVSVGLGAAVLTRRYIRSDPPAGEELDAVSRAVSERLSAIGPDIRGPSLVVGTGGTVAALAAMIHGIRAEEIVPERLNGRAMTIEQIKECLSGMKGLPMAERVIRLGLDEGRADVMVAGSLVVMGILVFLERPDLMVSMADLLEGLLIEDEEG